MSPTPISRSPDLQRLRDEGYHLDLQDGHLLLRDAPYVAPDRTVKRGILVTTLALAGDTTTAPDTHVVYFVGEVPCDQHGTPLANIINQSQHHQLAAGLEIDHTFSSKPPDGYPDYHAKLTTYATILEGPAQALEPQATARTFPVIASDDSDSVFKYLDTASSRAGIAALNDKLNDRKVAIAGLGGTGSHILDLLAKTPVGEIHLFDGDQLLQHNAFRSPGAPSLDDLAAQPFKVEYFAARYGQMRRGIVAHATYLDESNLDMLHDMDMVFVCVDDGPARASIIEMLQGTDVDFIDVGMGLQEADGSLGGVLRVTTSTPATREAAKRHLPLQDLDADNEYIHNIQVADLNALNAALAVIRWKRLRGYYRDLEADYHATYTIDGNTITNESELP
jgi:hypothetical protein